MAACYHRSRLRAPIRTAREAGSCARCTWIRANPLNSSWIARGAGGSADRAIWSALLHAHLRTYGEGDWNAANGQPRFERRLPLGTLTAGLTAGVDIAAPLR